MLNVLGNFNSPNLFISLEIRHSTHAFFWDLRPSKLIASFTRAGNGRTFVSCDKRTDGLNQEGKDKD